MLNTKPIVYADPPEAPLPQALGFPDLRKEWRIVRETAHLALAAPFLALAPRGSGEPVMLTPGWQTPQSSMEPLRRFLASKGYNAKHWGRGVNRGNVGEHIEKLLPIVSRRAEDEGCPVALVGWSLGGVVSREIAREIPDAVSCVVTFGSPILGGPVYTSTGENLNAVERRDALNRVDERERGKPIAVPMATIFSRLDSIVDWPACIDRYSSQVTHYEVQSTHLSMGLDPVVWRVVLDTLLAHARPE
ncbi:MAG: esterase/lipase family protein [Congregibacter sp.]